jgi:small GTP-binding protein
VIWDPAGQERFMHLTRNYFNQLDALVLVFDMTNASTFEGVLRWFKSIKDVKECPLLIVGNKADMESEIILSDQEMLEVSQFCNVPCFKVSAFTG